MVGFNLLVLLQYIELYCELCGGGRGLLCFDLVCRAILYRLLYSLKSPINDSSQLGWFEHR